MSQVLKKVKEYYQTSFNNATPEIKSFFEDHVEKVVNHARELSKEKDVDKELVEIAAWLHDISTIQGEYKNHHANGAKIAEKFLKTLNYPSEKIEKIKHCILNHRGSKERKVETKEAQILIDADAMTHFDEIELLQSTYYKTNKSVLAKLERSYNKMSPEAKKRVKSKIEKAREDLK